MAGHTFFCYTHEDTRFALKLAGALKQQGLDIWLDQWQAPQSEGWDRSITEAVLGCGVFLLVLSPEAVNSWVVREQTLKALRAGKRVLPVMCRPCRPPAAMGDHLVVDFSRSFQSGLAELLGLLGQRSAAQGGSVVSPKLRLFTGRLAWLWLIVGLGAVLLLGLAARVWWPEEDSEAAIKAGDEAPLHPLEPVILAEGEPLRQVEPESPPINTLRRAKDGKVMVWVAAGDFLMGSLASDLEADEDEKPQHTVYLADYWIDQTEVTNAEYQRCVERGGCTRNRAVKGLFTGLTAPVVGVRWEQAAAYCAWAGGRLPTEAEWEKAARGIDGRRFPWGNEFDGSRLNYCDANCIADWRDFQGDDGFRYTAPVGSYPAGASPYGALDMSGNVWEWTATWYDAQSYATATYHNPTGPEHGVQRVIRGGSWLYRGQSLRAARRHKDVPTSHYDNIGFRCAGSPAE
ncbi:MAG TPA: SUMF1/EgtB/PvdO family nonheme iron enzyme [Anaerolineae bacterium]|nr:SUMF1/EgtB/PvdO family nonheme iron enzyme [Anaerolineae bacterium]HMR63009.1 SUMF1/EgtB/PvdO family nonheme iron enzyme [Anaerolineae bacterium]